MEVHQHNAEPWRVTLVDTGETTMTGGRLRRVAEYIRGTFCMTYGDGVSDINLTALIAHHGKAGTEGTVTAIQPAGRYGALQIKDGRVTHFLEKPVGDGQWINGGFMVCEPSVLDRIKDDATPWEAAPMEGLAADGQLSVYRHKGFWSAMDTLRDKNQLEELWKNGKAPWKVWA